MEEAKADKEATSADANTVELQNDAIKAMPALFPEVERIMGLTEPYII